MDLKIAPISQKNQLFHVERSLFKVTTFPYPPDIIIFLPVFESSSF